MTALAKHQALTRYTEQARIATLEQQRDELAEVLRILYLETVDYITINNLGDPHHNQSMKMARAALSRI